MVVKYPEGPPEELKPGEGVNISPKPAEVYLDFAAPMGKCTKVYYAIAFQLPKWGFQTYKIEEEIFVSPILKPYYDLVISQKDTLQGQIKTGLASISTAISDLELIMHDWRKYKEYMDYYLLIEKGKKEGNLELIKKGDQTLRSIFIDQVDVHTGEGIALKLITSRWPTIIADFMQLSDEDIDPKKIKEKLKVSEAEGVVLATKNKLYLEWRDRLFRPTVEERYKTLTSLKEARKKSVEEYKNMLRPVIARFKMIEDALSKPSPLLKSVLRPDAQAFALDSMRIWAWRPFAPAEKWKITREKPLDRIHALKAGFTRSEIDDLHKELDKEGEKWDEKVDALPLEPSIDTLVRKMIKKIEDEYKVKITTKDLYKAREMLVTQFKAAYKGTETMPTWLFSPYYIFVEIPMKRSVIRFPDGTEMEGLSIENLKVYTASQNIIISRCLEIVARDKQFDLYINTLLGEYGAEGKKITEIVEEEYPEIYKKEVGERKTEVKESGLMNVIKKIRIALGKFFETLGMEVGFLRAEGPYEFAIQHRLAKYYLAEVSTWFSTIKEFFLKSFEFP